MGTRGARAALCGLALFCAFGLGQRPPGDRSCGPSRVLSGTGGDARCCDWCAQAEACPERTCTCVTPEFHCGDPQCTTCKHHTCPPGQQVEAHGTFTFGFTCVDCAAGTFSEGSEGRCRPWADCSQLGLRTLTPGNATHNAVCGLGRVPAVPSCLLSAVLALSACVLVLTVAQIVLHILQLRRQRVWHPETQLLLEDPPLQPPADACSCQFPEEERGEGPSEHKAEAQGEEDTGPLENLWV